jgi:hypothetical protein
MRGKKVSFERLLSVMPEGWEDKAKELAGSCSISKKMAPAAL